MNEREKKLLQENEELKILLAEAEQANRQLKGNDKGRVETGKNAEQELHAQQQLLQAIVNNIPTGLNVIRGRDLRIQLVNPAYQAVAPGKEMVGKTLDELWPETNRTFVDLCHQVLATGEPHHAIDELNMISRSPGDSPEPAYFTWSLIRVRLPGDDGWGILNTTSETTERKKLEVAISESEERFRTIAETTPVLISLSSLEDSTIVYTNPIYNKTFGYTQEELIGRKSPDLYYDPNDRIKITNLIKEQGSVRNLQVKVRKRDGSLFWLMTSVKAINYLGKPVLIGASIDITERKKVEEELQESESRFEKAFQGNPAALSISRLPDGLFVDVNESFVRMFGYERNELIGKKSTGIKLYSRADDRKNMVRLLREEGKFSNYEINAWNKNGESLTALISAEKINFKGEEHILYSTLDITERKRFEEKLRVSEQKLNDVYHSMTEGLALHEMLYDRKGKPINYVITDVNPSFENITGLNRSNILGEKATQVYSVKEAPYLGLYAEVVSTGKPVSFETFFPPMNKHFSISVFSPGKGKFATVFQDITERKQMEETIKASEKNYRELVKYAPTAIFEIDIRCQKFITVNDSMTMMSGYSREELLSMNPLDILGDESKSLYKSRIEMMLHGKTPSANVEYKLTAKDGHLIYAILNTSFKYDEQGMPVGAMVVGHDISERKIMEEDLKVALIKYKTLFDCFPLGITVANYNGNILESNKLSEILLSLTVEEQAQRKINGQEWQLISPDGEPLQADAYPSVRALKEKRPVENVEMGVIKPDNTTTWINVSAVPIPLEGYGVLISYSDISERKRTEDAIHKSEANLRGILEATKESIWMFSPDGIILQGNSMALSRMGASTEDVIGKKFATILPPELAQLRLLKLNQVVGSGQPVEFEDERAGLFFRHSFYPILDDNGRVTAVVSFSRDITERKKTEEKLQTNLQRFYLILSHMHNGLLLVAGDDKIEFVNQPFCDIFDLKDSPEELVNLSASELLQMIRPSYVDPDSAIARIREIVSQEQPVHGEYVIMSKERTFLRDFIPITLEGKRYGRLWNHMDITEEKKYEQNLHQMIRTLKAMQKSSLLMINTVDEKKFLQDVCKIIIEDCGHKMVWIGYKQDDPEQSVKPVAFAGFEENYLETLKITWSDTLRGKGPTGTAIRTGKTTLCRNMQTDPLFKPWSEEALKRGYSSSISLPLFMDDEVFGALMIYSKEPDPFSEDEQQLLSNLAHDLAYGIKAIRLNLALKQAKEDLEVKVEQRTSLLRKTLSDLDAESQRFQDVINLIPAYVALITPDHKIKFSNKIFRDNFGEIHNGKCHDLLFGKEEICENCAAMKVFATGQPYHWEGVARNDRIYQISDFPFTDSDGALLVLEIGVDMTEKRDMEKIVLNKVLETEEKDRRRFASDLHDDLGPTLSAIKLQLSLLANVKTSKKRNELLTTCDQLLLEGIDKMRVLANNIVPSLIESYGLEMAVKSFFQKMEKTCKMNFKLLTNLKGYRFDEETELHLYRIVTELVNNTIKHSGATVIYLDMSLTDQKLKIEYSDNGKGYNTDKDPSETSGIGLQNIKNRINLLQGTIDFITRGGKTVVMISKPLSEKSPNNHRS